MDDRYLFYAVSDPDWFDVPWGAPVAHDDDLTDGLPPPLRGQLERRGPWAGRAGPRPLPGSGWKIHVSATPGTAAGAVAAVADVCARTRTSWKTLRSTRLVRATQGKYAPRTLSGKVCTLYPAGEAELEQLLEDLGRRLRGHPGPRVVGDLPVVGTPLSLRWGAFDPVWVTDGGRTVPGVRAAGGALVPDDRMRPAPPGAPEPPCVQRVRVAAESADAAARLDVTGLRLLHRSNAGGVYAGTLRGRPVVLKEARHHSGVDAAGRDAGDRLRHERAVLDRLRGTGAAPEPLDLFTRGDSDFLVLEQLEGPNLALATARRHPGALPGATAAQVRDHHAWAARTAEELGRLLDVLHAHGVAHGDLHPGNVVCTPRGLRLVDFEGAALDGTAPACGLAAPGFDVGDRADPAQRDRACLDRVRLVLHVPGAVLLHHRPDLEPEFRAEAARARTGAAPRAPRGARGPGPRDLAAGIVASADPTREDRVFPGGVEQFATPLASRGLLHGATGVLLALRAAGVPPPAGSLRWLTAPGASAAAWPGLADGAHGLAVGLAVLGAAEEAAGLARALAATDAEVAGAAAVPDVTWGTGLAGRAVALREVAAVLGLPELTTVSDRLARRVAEVVLAAGEGSPVGPAGLLSGWAGTALALCRVAGSTAGPDGRALLTAAARRACALEARRLHRRGTGLLAGHRGALLPHLGTGSAAAGLAAAAVEGTEGGGVTEPVLERVRAGVAAAVAPPDVPTAGLLAGRAGFVLTLERLRADAAAVAVHRHRLSWSTVPGPRGPRVLGAQNLRFSTDLATGAAGVLLACLPDRCDALAATLLLPPSVRG